MDDKQPQNVLIRAMSLEDVGLVHQIDVLSFSTPWPERSYQFEVSQNQAARSWVVEVDGENGQRRIAAMAVLWMIVDEGHIATLAVHPDFRKQGLGRRLLAHALLAVSAEGAFKAFLEVRAGNSVAQKLYLDFGFEVVGVRPRYYRDNMEDALLMTLEPLPIERLRRIAGFEG